MSKHIEKAKEFLADLDNFDFSRFVSVKDADKEYKPLFAKFYDYVAKHESHMTDYEVSYFKAVERHGIDKIIFDLPEKDFLEYADLAKEGAKRKLAQMIADITGLTVDEVLAKSEEGDKEVTVH